MKNNNLLIKLRTKKLGLLIYDARMAAERSAQECAEAIGVSRYQFKEFEDGEQSPSLPVLEEFASYLNLPLDHFWDNVALSATADRKTNNAILVVQLGNRDKEIGQFLKEKREEQNLAVEELGEKTGQDVQQLMLFEAGEEPIPIPVLEILIKELNISLNQIMDHHGDAGSSRAQKNRVNQFSKLPTDMQEFICKPINHPYLELAKRLSELSSDKLRAIAESLLEITY